MKDIEDRLKEEYDKVEVPDYMFDTSRVFNRVKKENNSSRKIIISIAACIATILIIAITLILTMHNKIKEDETIIVEKSVDNVIKEKIHIKNNISNFNNNNIDTITTLKAKEILDYQIIDNTPYTRVKFQVLSNYLGNLTGEIEAYVPGGVFTIKDIKENVEYDQIDDISALNDDDKVKVTYYNEIYIPVVEEGKIYITSLNEIDGKLFVKMNAKYGFKEYDPETNIVKDDMGDEQLDIDRYLESINI